MMCVVIRLLMEYVELSKEQLKLYNRKSDRFVCAFTVVLGHANAWRGAV